MADVRSQIDPNCPPIHPQWSPRSLLGKGMVYDRDQSKWLNVRGQYLMGHVVECLEMCQYLLEGSPFGQDLMKATELDIDYETFKRVCYAAVLGHDLGKSGHPFQAMIWGVVHGSQDGISRPVGDRFTQLYRHEHLSLYLMLEHSPIRQWFLDYLAGREDLLRVAAYAAFGHHLKTDREIEEEIVTPVYLNLLRVKKLGCSIGGDVLHSHLNRYLGEGYL